MERGGTLGRQRTQSAPRVERNRRCPWGVRSRGSTVSITLAPRARELLGSVGEGLTVDKRKSKRKQEYDRYLNSGRWRANRQPALDRADGACEECGDHAKILHVHHLTYRRLFNELPEDLRVLCEDCHRLAHEKARAERRKNRRPRQTKRATKPRKTRKKKARVVVHKSVFFRERQAKQHKSLVEENERLHAIQCEKRARR